MATVLTRAVATFLLLPIFVTAMAVLVKGYAAPGDGFSAGVIAGTGILLQYVAFGYRVAERRLPVRLAPWLAAAGLLLALLVAFLPPLWGEPIMTHFPRPGAEVVHLGTLELLSAVLFDVAVFLVVVAFTTGAIGAIAHTIEEREVDSGEGEQT